MKERYKLVRVVREPSRFHPYMHPYKSYKGLDVYAWREDVALADGIGYMVVEVIRKEGLA